MPKQHPQTAYRKYAVWIGAVIENCDEAAAQDFVRRLFGWTILNGLRFYFSGLAASVLALSGANAPALPKGEPLA